MTRNQALLLFIVTFSLDSATNFAMESDAAIHRYGKFVVALGGTTQALGHIALPLFIVVVWVVFNLIRRRPLPQHFARNALLTMAGFSAAVSAANVLQALHGA